MNPIPPMAACLLAAGALAPPAGAPGALFARQESVAYAHGLRVVLQLEAAPEGLYACAEHLEVLAGAPGACPRCGRALLPAQQVLTVRLEDLALLRVPAAGRWPCDARVEGLVVGDRYLAIEAKAPCRFGCRLPGGPVAVRAVVRRASEARALRYDGRFELPVAGARP